jgi:hypothetical protein
VLCALSVMAAMLPAVTLAALGGDESTVRADGARMQAAVQRTSRAGYAMHEMKSAGGTIVREFVSPAGVVFGVSWQGPFMPDLRQLLGAHFDAFARSPHRARAGHARLLVTAPGLVVESTGHPRAFRGRAFLPDAVPAGISLESIQ